MSNYVDCDNVDVDTEDWGNLPFILIIIISGRDHKYKFAQNGLIEFPKHQKIGRQLLVKISKYFQGNLRRFLVSMWCLFVFLYFSVFVVTKITSCVFLSQTQKNTQTIKLYLWYDHVHGTLDMSSLILLLNHPPQHINQCNLS